METIVTVIVPAYNQGHYLGEAVRSALAQTYTSLEVLVIDDGSSDNTRQVAEGFSDNRVRYLYQENRGLSAARNTGIRHARGSLLTFLDSDDLFLPEKLSALVAALTDNPELGLVAGQALVINDRGEQTGEVFDRRLPEDKSQLVLGNPLHVGSVLLRRVWQERVGYFDETLRSYEDWDMWLRLAQAGCPMGSVERPVSLYRFHQAQMTRLGKQMTTSSFAVLDKTYRDPELPEAWRLRRNEAYSRAFLRAAAQAYTAQSFARASECMREAVRLHPELSVNGGERLARVVAGWANHAKTQEPLTFLEHIYDHLPEELAVMRQRRNRDLGKEALQLAFAAYRRGDMPMVHSTLWQAVRYQPSVLLDRGVVSLLFHAGMPGVEGTTQTVSSRRNP